MTDLRVLLERLSLEDKVSLLTGADFWTLPPLPQIGLDALVLSDGPAGVRGTAWDERDPSLLLPNPAALGATWDPLAVELAGRMLGAEARRKGVHVLLAPTLNIQRAPLAGRNFECFSEDAFLTARLAVAYVRGVQSCGVAATAKHFVGNDSENGRMTYDSRIPPEQLRETYLLPFEAAVQEAGVWAVMAAYNSVDGTTMTEHRPLLTGVLKEEWGFDGVVMSDWMATRSTHASATAGLDLVMPGPDGPWGPALIEAVKAGELLEQVVDEKVMRILRLASRVGALATFSPAPPVPADPPVPSLRRLAADGMVLLDNPRGILPLDSGELRKVALIGPNAVAFSAQGGGSAHVNPPYLSNVADSLRAALEGVELTVHTGVRTHGLLPAPQTQAQVEFLAADSSVLQTETRGAGRLMFLGGLPSGTTAIRLSARLDITERGKHQLSVIGVGAYTLTVDGQAHDFTMQAGGDDPAAQLMRPGQGILSVDLARGPVDIQIRHDLISGAPFTSLGWGHLPPHQDEEAELAAAVAAASTSDVAVVVVGTNDEVESEGFDRETLALPGRQNELVRRVAAANPRTIVVVNAGAPVLMPWRDDVAAILWAWLPGQEG
ncbi:MAG TPA: glycosyl hydrolase, partial [Micromonosporaceae bacterium]|nr:glycosyl hydrolase [Micromonosporaceae bacterium]